MPSKVKWGWEGSHECPDCGEGFDFFREEGFEMENQQWKVQVFHKHSEEYPEGRWSVAVWNRLPRRQRPDVVKDAEEQKKNAYKAKVAASRINNASS